MEIKIRRQKKINYDSKVQIRIKSETLEQYKAFYGKGYQSRIREILENHIEKAQNIERKEQEIRLKNLDVTKYLRK